MATWRYKKPDSGGHRGLKALLKYVTFREDAHHIVPEDGRERWHDGGLGETWREVYANSHSLAGQYILAHHFVISPDPDLMALLPESDRRDALAELTIQTLADWYQARDYAMPEASFVIHNRETTDDSAPGRQMLHTHVFCAGSTSTVNGRECPMVKERDVVRNKGGLDRETNLNRIVEQNWAAILDREIGLDWRIGRDLDRHLSTEKQPSLNYSTVDEERRADTIDSLPSIVSTPLPPIEPELLFPVLYDLESESDLETETETKETNEINHRSRDIGFF